MKHGFKTGFHGLSVSGCIILLMALTLVGTAFAPVSGQVLTPVSKNGPASEDSAEPIEILGFVEHPSERFECWALAKYRKDDYVVRVNDFVKSTWRLTRVFHGRVFFENVINGEKVIEKIYPTSPPSGADPGHDRSDSLRIVSRKILFSQALHLIARAGGLTVISGSSDPSFVTVNFSDVNFKKSVVTIAKEAGLLATEDKGFLVVHGRDRTGSMGDLFMEMAAEAEEPGPWQGLVSQNLLGPLYLTDVSLAHCLERISLISGISVDSSALDGDYNVTICTGSCDPVMAVRLLAASCGLSARIDNGGVVIDRPENSPVSRKAARD